MGSYYIKEVDNSFSRVSRAARECGFEVGYKEGLVSLVPYITFKNGVEGDLTPDGRVICDDSEHDAHWDMINEAIFRIMETMRVLR